MSIFSTVRNACAWSSAVLIAVMPFVVAADFGGVLWWTQFGAALAVLVAAVLALIGTFGDPNSRLLRQHVILLPLVLWCLFALCQLVALDPGLVKTLSGGSFVAYTQWIAPFLGPDGIPSQFPISINPEQSTHSLAVLLLVVGLVWTVSMTSLTRSRLALYLTIIAIGAGLHSAFGIFRILLPNTGVLDGEIEGGFGCFVNKNNAALMLNLGFAASLGLLGWRISALTGQEVDDEHFEFNDLFSLLGDRDSWFGIAGALLCSAGLLVCGSRGGLVGCMAGMLLALGWIRQRRGFRTLPVVAATILATVALLFVPLSLDYESIKRFAIFPEDDVTTLLRDGRLDHWQDGWRTGVEHFPAGSGLGTYAYAYLPYQQTSSHSWYQHADNLWLELFVEQGIIGILLVVVLFGIWIRTLVGLYDSADPIDQGLRVAGWYAVGAIVASQFFDFGLIIPSNLFVAAILVAICVSRGVVAGTERASIVMHSMRSRMLGAGLAFSAIFLTGLSVWQLRKDAEIESVARSAELNIDALAGDLDGLDSLASDIQQAPNSQSSPILLAALTKVHQRKARLMECLATTPITPEEVRLAYAATKPAIRRTRWRSESEDELDGPGTREADVGSAVAEYRKALESSERSLRALPLGMESRTSQLYLDFVHRDPNRTRAALEQLREFYHRQPETLILLGSYAADSREFELATDYWRSALEIRPRLIARVLEAAAPHANIDLNEVLASDPYVFRYVSRQILRLNPSSSDPLLERAVSEIACETCENKKERAACEELAGDVSYALEDFDEAFEHYKNSVRQSPSEPRLQLKLIQKLREQNLTSEARSIAIRARDFFEDDERFQREIDDMAADTLKGLETR